VRDNHAGSLDRTRNGSPPLKGEHDGGGCHTLTTGPTKRGSCGSRADLKFLSGPAITRGKPVGKKRADRPTQTICVHQVSTDRKPVVNRGANACGRGTGELLSRGKCQKTKGKNFGLSFPRRVGGDHGKRQSPRSGLESASRSNRGAENSKKKLPDKNKPPGWEEHILAESSKVSAKHHELAGPSTSITLGRLAKEGNQVRKKKRENGETPRSDPKRKCGGGAPTFGYTFPCLRPDNDSTAGSLDTGSWASQQNNRTDCA